MDAAFCGPMWSHNGSAARVRKSRVCPCASLSRRNALGVIGLLPFAIFPVLAEVRVSDSVPTEEVQTESGLKYYDFRTGKGTTATKGSTVTVHYTCGTTGARYGWKIDSSHDREEPLRFKLGSGAVIAGLDEAIQGMAEGGTRRAIIPSKIGYRSGKDRPMPSGFENRQRFKNIFLNSNRPYVPDLVFDIELLRVRQ
mmetsp:Transcript_3356/g.10218  ORF Transcript_3356/g.10218 Transcript_3356/m.10218 type:complete len:197 (+) Transcript_3356:98-688(+)